TSALRSAVIDIESPFLPYRSPRGGSLFEGVGVPVGKRLGLRQGRLKTRSGSSRPALRLPSATNVLPSKTETSREPAVRRALSVSICRGSRTIGRPCLRERAS